MSITIPERRFRDAFVASVVSSVGEERRVQLLSALVDAIDLESNLKSFQISFYLHADLKSFQISYRFYLHTDLKSFQISFYSHSDLISF